VRNPKVFLMDEPLSNLDAKLRVQMRSEIAALHKRLNATTIYVTHDQVEAMTMGDRIVILNGGKIQQVDTPLRVYHEPANVFVAGFVGQMNFLTGILEAGGLRLGDSTLLALPESLHGKTAEWHGRGAILGLRPEHVLPESSPEVGTVFEVTPERVEMLGSEQMIHFALSGQPVVARWASDIPVSEGQPLKVKIENNKALLFDGASENRIV
jgi:multiple sugar transport system ATP-binding protein